MIIWCIRRGGLHADWRQSRVLSMFHCTPKHETTSHIQYTVVPDETRNNTLAINSSARSILMTSLVMIFFPRSIYCHPCASFLYSCLGENQAATKARQKRGQITLGVFPNCHECQKLDFPVLIKTFRLFTSWPKTHGVLEIPWTSGASGCITSCSLYLDL